MICCAILFHPTVFFNLTIDKIINNNCIYLIRSCIVGCYTTEDYFLAKGGVCLLLDMLSVSS